MYFFKYANSRISFILITYARVPVKYDSSKEIAYFGL